MRTLSLLFGAEYLLSSIPVSPIKLKNDTHSRIIIDKTCTIGWSKANSLPHPPKTIYYPSSPVEVRKIGAFPITNRLLQL